MAETYTDTNIIRAENFASLEAALDFAISEGGNRTVILKPGATYTLTGAFTINQDNITIEGNGATINLTSAADVFIVSSGVEYLTIRNVFATHSTSGVVFCDQVGGSYTTLENVHVTDMALYRTTKDGTNIHKNLRLVRCSAVDSPVANSINLQACDNALLENIYIENSAGDGIKLNVPPVTNTTVRNVHVNGAADDGFDQFGGGGNTLIENCIWQDCNVTIKGGGDPWRQWLRGATIRNCVFGSQESNTRGGIEINGIFVPFRFDYGTITGDGSTGPYDVTHALAEDSPFIECRVFNGATELTGGGTDFSFTTPDTETVAVTFASALGIGVERQVVLGYTNPPTSITNIHEEVVSSGSSSYAINHGLGTQYEIDVIAWDNTTQTETAYDSITYTDENNCTVVFSGNLANDHRVYVRAHMHGQELIEIGWNTFYLANSGVSISGIVVNGAAEFDIHHNLFLGKPDSTRNENIMNIRPPARTGRIAWNTFKNIISGTAVYVITVTDVSDTGLGMNDPQARLIVEHNTSFNHENRFISIGVSRLHLEMRDNQSIDFGGSANNQFVGTAGGEAGYTRIWERNYNVVDGAITQVFTASAAALGDGDTTPNVQGRTVWATANTGATTYTDFGGLVENGYRLTLVVGDGNSTFDFSGTKLKGNAAADLSPASGDVLHFVHYNGDWYLVGHADIA